MRKIIIIGVYRFALSKQMVVLGSLQKLTTVANTVCCCRQRELSLAEGEIQSARQRLECETIHVIRILTLG